MGHSPALWCARRPANGANQGCVFVRVARLTNTVARNSRRLRPAFEVVARPLSLQRLATRARALHVFSRDYAQRHEQRRASWLVSKPDSDAVSEAPSSQTPHRSSPWTSTGATPQLTPQATPSTLSRSKQSSWLSADTPKSTETRLQGEPDIPAATLDTFGTCLTAFEPTDKSTFQTASANIKATPDLSTRRRRNVPSGPGCDDDIDLAAIEAAGRRVRLFMGSLGALVVLFAVLVVVLPFFTEPLAMDSGPAVCGSPMCALYGLRLSTSVNESGEPCRDFYEFACGGWSQVHTDTSALRVMADAVLDQLVEKFHELSATSEGTQTAVKKAAILYETCEAMVRHGRDELPQFRKILDAVNLRWPRETHQPKLLDILINLAAEKGYAPVFELRYNASSHQLSIEPVYQLKRIFELRATQRDAGKYWGYFVVYCSVFGMTSPRKSVFDELDALESAAIPYIDDAYRAGKPVTRFFASLDNMASEMGGFGVEDWWKATNRHVGVVGSVNVTHWQALRVLGTLADTLGSASLFRCLEWWIVQDLGPWFHGELAALEYGGSRHAQDLRARQCLGLVERYMGLIAWAPVSTPAHVVDDVTHVVHAVWKAAVDSFGSAPNGKDGLAVLAPALPPVASFVTQKTVEKMALLYEHYPAMTKDSFAENFMKAMRTRHYLRSQFKRETVSFSPRMSMATASVEVYDSQERKMIMFPYALTSPLYEDGIVESVKFAGLGSKIADAIFRNATSAYRSSHGGQLPALLADSVACLRASYAEPNTDNGVATAELDHISRAFALESSWRAFRAEALLGSGGEDVRLKNFDGYSAEKTFFVTWCHVLCSTDEPGMAKRSCNEALKQSSNFARVFRCKKADAVGTHRLALPALPAGRHQRHCRRDAASAEALLPNRVCGACLECSCFADRLVFLWWSHSGAVAEFRCSAHGWEGDSPGPSGRGAVATTTTGRATPRGAAATQYAGAEDGERPPQIRCCFPRPVLCREDKGNDLVGGAARHTIDPPRNTVDALCEGGPRDYFPIGDAQDLAA
ncbi:hypothetical protein HPB49_016610 [Dermacentor silvarum]|uniref:Uncharacterized protein n=1 Tax=Dermacentor silvarum TaxID=543639 RepID=A0ACB8DJI1_DERSI|nr:hypothetical protein HPB49_016610 [Dermacentor silvarum]